MRCIQQKESDKCYAVFQDVEMLYINGAWLPSTTVCTRKLYKHAKCTPIPSRSGYVTTEFDDDVFFPVVLDIKDNGNIQISGYLGFSSPLTMVSATYDSKGRWLKRVVGGTFTSSHVGAMDVPVTSMAIQPDGKTLLAGYTYETRWKFHLARYNTDGLLDVYFGNNGKITTSLGTIDDECQAVLLQPDGKIIAGGYKQLDETHLAFALIRYNTDGSLDTSFGTGGVTASDIGAYRFDQITSLALQSDGKIIASGMSLNSSVYQGASVMVRYNTNGSIDTSFGTGGLVFPDDILVQRDRSHGLLVQADGKIVISSGFSEFSLRRFNANGSIDTSFGIGGVVTTSFGTGNEAAWAIVQQDDGKIIAGGWCHTGNSQYDFALARYNADGTLDSSFGNNGTVVSDFGTDDDEIFALKLQSDGKILAGGFTHLDDAKYGFIVARYDTNGDLDDKFGTVVV